MKIIWHGHACFEIVSSDGSIVLDPYADGKLPGLTLPTLHADAVVCSHSHADHSASEKVVLSGKAPRFKLTHIPTWHDECQGKKRGANSITVIEAEGLRLAHMGDLGHMPTQEQFKLLGRVDILMIPVGSVYTIDAVTAKEITDKLKPLIVIPMHYKGEGVGLENISGCDRFTELFPEKVVQYKYSPKMEVNMPAEPCVWVPAWPK